MTGRYKAYPEYKNSGNSFIQVIPKHWSRIIVGNVSNVIDPQPDHRAPDLAKDGQGFPYIGIRDVNNDGTLNFSTARYVEEIAVIKQEKSFQIEKDDIVFCKVGTLGEPRKIKPHGRCALSATLVLIKAGPKVDSQYLLYALDSSPILSQTELLATGSTRAALGIQQIRKFQIPFAPLDEQQKIANFLDHETAKIDTLISKQEKLIELLKEKRQAVISHAVTKGLNQDAPMKDSGVEWLGEVPEHWVVLPTKRFFRLVAEPSTKNHNKELLSVYAAIGVAPRKELEQKGNKASNTDGYWLVQKGDIIVNKLLAWMGAVGYSDYDGVTSPAYDILRKTKDINPKFYHYLFRQEFTQKEFKRWSRGIMEMRLRLYFEELGRIMMPMPPKEEQNAIVDEIEAMNSMFSKIEDKARFQIGLLTERKTALISAAVTGKIDVRDWDAQGVQG